VEFILKILEKTKDFYLVKIGSFTKRQTQFLKDKGLNNRVKIFQAIDIDSLVELYNAADILIMPSLAEGFGFPILEAMTCGCPVICSDTEVFHELYEDAVVFIDPSKIDEAIDKINMVLNDLRFRSELLKKAFVRSRQFSWQKCAKETYKVYEDVFYKA